LAPRIFDLCTIPGRCNIAGAISLFLNIAGAIAPVAPVLNTPLEGNRKNSEKLKASYLQKILHTFCFNHVSKHASIEYFFDMQKQI
jgi:hypothetical protein